MSMPYEGDDCMTDEFTDQLSIIKDIISSHPDRHVIVGGDCIDDLARMWAHNAR